MHRRSLGLWFGGRTNFLRGGCDGVVAFLGVEMRRWMSGWGLVGLSLIDGGFGLVSENQKRLLYFSMKIGDRERYMSEERVK